VESRTLETLTEESPSQEAVARSSVEVAAGPGVTMTELRPTVRAYVKSAWDERGLLLRLGARFLARFIYGTKLGRSWLIIRPLVDSLGMTLLFGNVLRVGAPRGVPYYLFVMSGLLGWRLFERGLRYSTRSFNTYRKMMKTFRLPLLLVPLGAMAYPVVEIAVYWLVFLGAAVFFWAHDGRLWLEGPPQLLLVVPGYALLVAFTVGCGLWLSVLNAKARDTRFVLRFVVTPWLFITPVVYPLTQLQGTLRWVALINPMTAPIMLLKSGLTGTGQFELTALGFSLGFTALVLGSGLWFYTREAARSIDAIESSFDDEDEERV
jgi:lipopolysaccharide transport system permease protein